MVLRRILISSALVLALCFFATAAGAKRFSMTGSWFQNRGPLVDIPQKGPVTACIGGQAPGFRANPQTGCQGGLKPAQGGIPGSGIVTAMNADSAGPATLMIPSGVFGTIISPKSVQPVALIATVVQLSSTFNVGPNQPGTLQPNAPTNDPGQALRGGANFTWCWNAPLNPACPAGITLIGNTLGGFPNPQCTANGGPIKCVASAGLRTQPPSSTFVGAAGNPTPSIVTSLGAKQSGAGLVKYKSGPNRYGGTMAMLQGGGAVVSISGPNTNGLGQKLAFHQVVNTAMTTNPQHPGRGYAITDLDNFPAFPLFLGFATNFPCTNVFPPLPAGCGIITGTGPPFLVTVPTPNNGTIMVQASAPADTNVNVGFPWTTGTVYAFNTGVTNLGGPATSLLTAMGSNMLTVGGRGSVTVVAGGATRRVGAGADFAALDSFTMTIADTVPSMSPVGFAAGALMMVLAAGYALRRRL